MDRFIDHTADSLSATGATMPWRRRVARLALAPLLALSVFSATLLPAGATQAAAQSAKPDLDVVQCTTQDDPIDYGDGIDWYKVNFTYRNKGNASAPAFKYHTRPTYGTDMFSGQVKNEAFVVHNSGSLQPGQSASTFVWVTKKVVNDRTWGIFLDNNGFNQGTVVESIENNNHCTAFANP